MKGTGTSILLFGLVLLIAGSCSYPERHYTTDQPYPHPFCPTTTISYEVDDSADVELLIYNVEGQCIDTLVNERQGPGQYQITWDAVGVTSGIYFYKLVLGDSTVTKKMVLLK